MFISTAVGVFSCQKDDPNPVTEFINSLNEEQKRKAIFSFDDEEKSVWHYLPATSFQRRGLPLKEMSKEQQGKVFKLLSYSLSEVGYEKVMGIRDLENVLAEQSGDTNRRDPEKYYVAFYGNPVKDDLWFWSFEGHHVSLKFTIDVDEVYLAPRFLGANPAIIQSGPRKGEQALKNEEALGFELINSMNVVQQEKAIFRNQAYPDIVTANDSEVSPLKPVGISTMELSGDQKSVLVAIINEFISLLPRDKAEEKMQTLRKEEMAEIQFGWAGGLKPGEPHYYRIQGKSFLIELDNTQNNANHIHTVWREFEGDFGKDVIREHYKNSDHHKH